MSAVFGTHSPISQVSPMNSSHTRTLKKKFQRHIPKQLQKLPLQNLHRLDMGYCTVIDLNGDALPEGFERLGKVVYRVVNGKTA